MTHLLAMSERQNHRCCYCGHRMIRHQHQQGRAVPVNAMTKDHVLARCYGGKNHNNIVIACSLCNELRGHIPANVFYALQQRWFAADQLLQARWHYISHEEYRYFLAERIRVHDLYLRLKARTSAEYGHHHYHFLRQHGHRLKQRA